MRLEEKMLREGVSDVGTCDRRGRSLQERFPTNKHQEGEGNLEKIFSRSILTQSVR